MSNVGYTRFGPDEDDQLRSWDSLQMPVAEQAERLNRPVGSVKSRRRILGLSKSRPEQALVTPQPLVQYQHEPTLTFVAVLMCFLLFGLGLTALGEL